MLTIDFNTPILLPQLLLLFLPLRNYGVEKVSSKSLEYIIVVVIRKLGVAWHGHFLDELVVSIFNPFLLKKPILCLMVHPEILLIVRLLGKGEAGVFLSMNILLIATFGSCLIDLGISVNGVLTLISIEIVSNFLLIHVCENVTKLLIGHQVEHEVIL